MSDDHAQSDAAPQLSLSEWQELTVRVLRSCGYGRLLLVGLRDVTPVCEFLRNGVDVTCLVASPAAAAALDAAVPGRTRVLDSTMTPRPETGERFDTVVFVVDPSTPEAWLDGIASSGNLLRLASDAVVVLCGRMVTADAVSGWDARLAGAGARRPMLSGGAVQRGVGDRSAGMAVLRYRLASAPAADDPVGPSNDRCCTGGDGGQSAREMLYDMATRLMRPNDRVLGVGVGPEMKGELLANTAATSIVCVPPHVAGGSAVPPSPAGEDGTAHEDMSRVGLRDYDADTFDFILIDGTKYALSPPWDEAARVLTPGGRLCVLHVVGHEDVQESGATIREQMEACGLLFEEGWLARCVTGPEESPVWVTKRLSTADTLVKGGDRLALALMNPVASRGARAKVGPGGDDSPNVLAFARDYDNPWLVRGLVAMGLRATSVDLRVRMAEEVLTTANEGSADYGAALCVRCYAAIEQGADAQVLTGLLRRAAGYADSHAVNPSVLRWQISLLYVAGLMAMQTGDLRGAESLFSRVRKFDALDFSPLLGTKTVGAAYWQGLIAFARGDSDAARAAWTHAVEEARRLLQQGNWREVIADAGCPVTFGLPELAAVALEAARAAGGLHALGRFPDRPALVWQSLHCTVADTAQAQGLELRAQRLWISELERAKAWLEQHTADWEMQARRKDEEISSLSEAYALLEEGKAWLEKQWSAWEAEANSKEAQVTSLLEENRRLQQSVDQAEGLQRGLAERIPEKDRELHVLEGRYRSLADQYAQLVQGAAVRELELAAQNRKLQESALQLAQRMDAMLGEIRAVAGASIEEGRRLRALESTRWFRLGRRLGLIG